MKYLLNSPELTWRDVQYLVVYTSNPNKTTDLYIVNAAGILTSREFGFGLMDAEAMVTRARHWINVPPQIEHQINSTASGLVLSTFCIEISVFKVLIKHDLCSVLHVTMITLYRAIRNFLAVMYICLHMPYYKDL